MNAAKRIQRWVVAVAVICVVQTILYAVWLVATDPMGIRRSRLESDLERQSVAASSTEALGRSTDYRAAYGYLQNRPGLWTPLIAPPAPTRSVARPPTREQKLGGLLIEMEMTTVEGDTLVNITDTKDKTSRWRGVGDVLRGDMKIVEIKPDRVVFEFTFGRRDIQYDWPRR